MVNYSPRQLASPLIQAIAAYAGQSAEQLELVKHAISNIHFHDGSSSPEIVFNDVQAIRAYNEATNSNVPQPLVASEGYQQHSHTGPYDGGYIAPAVNRTPTFAIYSPGTSFGQQTFSL